MGAFVASSIRNKIVTCGVNSVELSNNMTPAKRIATDIFKDNFDSCEDKTFEEVDSDFKTYSDMNQHQVRIRILPGTKINIKAFSSGHVTIIVSDVIHRLQVTLLGMQTISCRILRLTRYLSRSTRLLPRRLSRSSPQKTHSGLIRDIVL